MIDGEHQALVESERYSERCPLCQGRGRALSVEEESAAAMQPGGIHSSEDGGRPSSAGGDIYKRAVPQTAEREGVHSAETGGGRSSIKRGRLRAEQLGDQYVETAGGGAPSIKCW